MSKLLILPDIHGRKFWRKAVENNINSVDKIIFLGDYLDPYPQEIKENPELMECTSFDASEGLLHMLEDIVTIKKSIPNKVILLTGNHTDSYIWPKFAAATRTDRKNYDLYHNFFLKNLDLFNLVHIENDVIFSHAGISEGWANHVWEQLEYPKDELSSVIEIAEMLRDTPLKNFNEYYIEVISNISHFRFGDYLYGSCEWADLREHVDIQKSVKEIVPIGENGIYQVFGHTQLKEPLITEKWACLDCRKGFIFDTDTHDSNSCL